MATDPQTGLDIPDEQQQAATAQGAADTLTTPDTPLPGPQAGQSPFPLPSPNPDDYPPLGAPPNASAAPVSPPAPNAAAPGTPAADQSPVDIGPPPALPKPTGNYQADMDAFQRYSADLTNYQGRLQQAHAAVQSDMRKVGDTQAQRERDLAEENVLRQQEENERRQKERAVQQQAIDQAVQQRMAREADTGRSWWADASTRDKVAAHVKIIAGGFAQGLSNAAAAQLGVAGNAKNEGLAAVNKLIDDDRKLKFERLSSADKSLLDARYGMKDSEENHRAMLNDIDADSAAKYKMIAKQAAADMRARGVPEAEIQNNQAIAELYQKGSEYQDKILDRQEQRRLQEQHERATEALANANLGVARGGLELRRADFAAGLSEKQREFDERNAGKAAAAKEKVAEDEDKRTLRDPDTGETITVLGNAKAVTGQAEKLAASRAYSTALRNLADHVEKNGRVGSDLPLIGTAAGRERETLYNEAVARGRKALDLGVSNANIQIEHGTMGGSGAGLSPHQMADPTALRRLADENDKIALEKIRASGKPAAGKTQADITAAVKPKPSAPAKPDKAKIDRAWQVYQDSSQPAAERKGAFNFLRMSGQINENM